LRHPRLKRFSPRTRRYALQAAFGLLLATLWHESVCARFGTDADPSALVATVGARRRLCLRSCLFALPFLCRPALRHALAVKTTIQTMPNNTKTNEANPAQPRTRCVSQPQPCPFPPCARCVFPPFSCLGALVLSCGSLAVGFPFAMLLTFHITLLRSGETTYSCVPTPIFLLLPPPL